MKSGKEAGSNQRTMKWQLGKLRIQLIQVASGGAHTSGCSLHFYQIATSLNN
jgi:hypothetical protein